jgi:hypothetical protein
MKKIVCEEWDTAYYRNMRPVPLPTKCCRTCKNYIELNFNHWKCGIEPNNNYSFSHNIRRPRDFVCKKWLSRYSRAAR